MITLKSLYTESTNKLFNFYLHANKLEKAFDTLGKLGQFINSLRKEYSKNIVTNHVDMSYGMYTVFEFTDEKQYKDCIQKIIDSNYFFSPEVVDRYIDYDSGQIDKNFVCRSKDNKNFYFRFWQNTRTKICYVQVQTIE
jgi:hypothetical protein